MKLSPSIIDEACLRTAAFLFMGVSRKLFPQIEILDYDLHGVIFTCDFAFPGTFTLELDGEMVTRGMRRAIAENFPIEFREMMGGECFSFS